MILLTLSGCSFGAILLYMSAFLDVVNLGMINWYDYSVASLSIGFLVGAVIAMFLLINWMKGV